VLGSLFFLLMCTGNDQIILKFDSKMVKIQKKYVPDLSLEVFRMKLINENDQWILNGETTRPEVKNLVASVADSILGANTYLNKLKVLPDSSLRDSIYGIVRISVANLRDEPRERAQLIDQNIMGQILHLLKKEKGWYLVWTEYHYLGWCTEESFIRTDSAGAAQWQSEATARVNQLFPLVYSQPAESSEPVSDVVLNARLKIESQKDGWSKVILPDNRAGFIRAKFLSLENFPQKSPEVLRKDIIATARSMMGLPYLWGGNSSKGNDCSGFTHIVFKSNGIQLPRDSRQQALLGQEIIADEFFSNILPGDLFFFGSTERVSHVGISLGGADYIDQSGMVQISSLDSTAKNFSPYRKKTLKTIRRVF
jgi:hypothetical protein